MKTQNYTKDFIFNNKFKSKAFNFLIITSYEILGYKKAIDTSSVF